jgi:hypothetical protein
MKLISAFLTPTLIALLPLAAVAGPVTGSVTASFSNPVLTGNIRNPDGTTTFYDNSATAVDSLSGPIATWGTNPGTSFLIFSPNTAVNVASGQSFLLGTIDFGNGTSALDTLIFGVDLTLGVNATTGGPVDPLVAHLAISTSSNSGTDPYFDADSITISGLQGITTLNAFEGAVVKGQLFGRIVGDPSLELTELTLAPDQQGNGFVNGGPIASAAPEPSGFLIFGSLALFGVGCFRRKRTA